MAQQNTQRRGRGIERVFILLASALFLFLFIRLYGELEKDFLEVPRRLQEGTLINLNDDRPGEQLKRLLQKGFYFEDPRDIDFIGSIVTERMGARKEVIDNIGELNKRKYDVEAEQAFARGGESFRKRVRLSRALLGFAGPDSLRFEQEVRQPPPLPATVEVGGGDRRISGTVEKEKGRGVQGVLVRLELLLPQDSVYSEAITEVDNTVTEGNGSVRRVYAQGPGGKRQLQSLSAYARTDAEGKFRFAGLPGDKAYELLPLKPGFQFGATQGTSSLEKDASFTFHQSPHRLKLLSTRDFNNLKKEKALMVRTPAEFSRQYWITVAVFLLSFLVVHILLTLRFPAADQLVLPVLMVLTGISFVTLLSLQDPLRDRFLGQGTTAFFAGGMAGLCILLFLNLRRFTPDSTLYRMLFLKTSPKAAGGAQWGVLAIGLLLLTILFGTGPEGSGVKVNLFGFQPSEIVKFLILVFLAGFFATNEKFIADYRSWQKRWSFFSFALFAIVAAILLFLVLGDLGPAIVCCFSFIILFSFSRGDFLFMAGAVLLFCLSVWILDNVWLGTALTALLVAGAIVFGRKQMSESAVMALVVIAGFLLLDQVPLLDRLFPGPIRRLVDRKAIWLDPWNNEVFGGDHVANSIWAMSSGGVTGQGVGEGFAKTIPEAHTDMILPSFGEEFGWAGILCVFILFLIYLHRAVLIGRQTGTPFLFYLCAGIGVATFVQFLLIAGGSIGALPLSGVSLPFISYGGSSLVINLLAAGFLLAASSLQGSAVQLQYLSRRQDKNLMPALLAACTGIVLLSVTVSRYLFHNQKWVVQPALVADRSGARMFSYNPRIAILMNRLQAGVLYDRKGRVLAASQPAAVQRGLDSLVAAGLDRRHLERMMHRRLDRYYPFAEQMFFWTGDLNTGIFYGGTNGYFAEYEHLADLRGFATPGTNITATASRFREERFLPETATEMTVTQRDYSVLSPLLLAGINSPQVDAFKKRNRNVQLSLDARLQTGIQQSLATDDSLAGKRISVVVLEDRTGDVLASAAYPLPPVTDWETMNLGLVQEARLPYWINNNDPGFTQASQPGSTAKLVTALAAFNKLGAAAARKTIVVRPGDLIRVSGDEPDETGPVTLERAIVKSNNPFFIRLANEERLQEEMATLYLQTGMFLRGLGGYFYEQEANNLEQQNKWREYWRKTEFRSLASYNPNDIRATRGRGISGMAWGQGELVATPAAVARLSAGIANSGSLVPNRYVLKISDSVLGLKEPIPLAKEPDYARLMTRYMLEQSAGKVAQLGIKVAGKTGTPERIVKKRRIKDGWYTFFAPKAAGPGHVAVCVRVEDCKGSSVAVKTAGKHVVPVLLQLGYIKSFPKPAGAPAGAPPPALPAAAPEGGL
ncbi:FtsW/RodA/SpoVE family cell cycle protein [Paraflavisolibacter sp. H34]|uniref:FtsW/RodA/SpoVE family cell cycle protein n=1 Tax=Huijunlia imazamoxiresistens TaxID=3127457 RepID=UPI003018169C